MPATEVLRTETSWIEKNDGVCGGDACIRGTRIAVFVLVEEQQMGWSEQQILTAHRLLSPADLQAAWLYFADHREEINAAIRDNAQS